MSSNDHDSLRRAFFVGVALLCSLAGDLAAQGTGTIRGRITETRTGQPVADAQVQIVARNLTALSNRDGQFVMSNVPAGSHTLRVRLIGFASAEQPVEVTAGATTNVDVVLQPQAIQLSEVVVTGTPMATEKRALANAVTTVNVEEITRKATVLNVQELLQGRAVGVTILPNSGAPGTAGEIRIRGTSSLSGYTPVVYIDGIRYNIDNLGNFNPTGAGLAGQGQSAQVTSALNFLNPEDIESIEILKGPAAATLYGAEAAAGVIQIITKKGQRGEQQIRWNARYERGESEWRLPTPVNFTTCDSVKQANATTWPGCQGVPRNTILTGDPLRDDPQALRVGDLERISLSLRGGGDRYAFYLSGDTDLDQGVFFNSYQSRKSLRANFTIVPNANTEFVINTGYSRTNLRLPYQDESAGALLLSATRGKPGSNLQGGSGWGTIRPERSNLYNNTTRSDRFTLGSTLNYRPFEWLNNRLTAGMDLTSSLAQLLSPPGEDDAQGYSAQRTPRTYIYSIDYAGSADYPLSRWNIHTTTSVGAQIVARRDEALNATGVGLASPDVVLIGSSTTTSGSNSFTENNSVGYYGQEQIAWRDRLYLTAGLRADDHSSFGADFDWIFYPKLGLSWVLSEEPAFDDYAEMLRMDEFRFRAAWGRAGRAPSAYSAPQTYTVTQVTLGTGSGLGVVASSPGNPKLAPEKGEEIEVGFDAGFFGGRAAIEFTYYDKSTTDMLVSVPTAPSGGFTASRLDNLGEVTNSGVELGVTATPVQLESFEWNTRVTLSTNKNRLVDFGIPGLVSQSAGFGAYTPGYQIHREGYPLASYWLPRPLLDANGEIQLNAGRTAVLLDTASYFGPAIPTREIGFSNTIRFLRHFQLYALLDYKGGHHLMNYKEYNRCRFQDNCARMNDPQLRFPDTRADTLAYHYWRTVPSAYLEEADFVKLRDLSISYELPRSALRYLRANGATLTLAGHNLALWSDYSGYDPEVNSYGNRTFVRADVYAAPMARRLTLSANVSF